MSDDLRLERITTSLMSSAAPSRAPEGLLDDTLTSIGRTRQRARWLAFIKEPPMRTPTGVVVGSPTVRLAAFVALTLALLLGLTAAVATAATVLLNRSAVLPAPYGPADNGPIVFGRDGDILLINPDGTGLGPLIDDASDDSYPLVSPDGTRFVFTRTVAGEPAHVMVAKADGTGVTQIADVPGPLERWTWTDWAPDSRHMLVSWAVDGHPTIAILDADGVEPARSLDVGDLTPAEFASWRPPDGDEIVFAADNAGRMPTRGIYAIRPDGTGLRPLELSNVVGCPECLFQQPSLSPDGARMSYQNWETNEAGVTGGFVHLLDLTTLQDERLILDPAQQGFGFSTKFSPDGRSLLFEVDASSPGDAQLVIAPIDGHEPARLVGPAYPNDLVTADFSPDGRFILMERGAGSTWIIDAASGEATQTDTYLSGPSWQRLGH